MEILIALCLFLATIVAFILWKKAIHPLLRVGCNLLGLVVLFALVFTIYAYKTHNWELYFSDAKHGVQLIKSLNMDFKQVSHLYQKLRHK